MMITPVIIHKIQNTRPRADLGDRSPYLWGKTRLLRAGKRQYILKRQLRLSFSKSALAENDCLPDCCHGYQGPPEAFPRSSKKWRRKFSRVTGVVLAKEEYHKHKNKFNRNKPSTDLCGKRNKDSPTCSSRTKDLTFKTLSQPS